MSHRRKWSHESKVALVALAAGLPSIISLMALLLVGDYSNKLRITLGIICGLTWLGAAFSLKAMVARPLETIANLLMALREGDFSLRGHGVGQGAYAEAVAELNAAATMLREKRLEEAEAVALLTKIMEEVDIGLFAWDASRHLRLVNRAGARLLGKPAQALVGVAAEALGLTALLEGEAVRSLDLELPGGSGPWELRRGQFRQGGAPHTLVVLTDVRQALRKEEREAWQRLIRVLGHELNNSLAPIQSLASSLRVLMGRTERGADWEKDVLQGLSIIERRSESLSRFMTAYAKLARLPPPTLKPVDVRTCVMRAVAMERRLNIEVQQGPALELKADGDQLEQLLINLLRNATDAALETGGIVEIGWAQNGGAVELWVKDEGLGIANPDNLFVPFFTTKPGGSGVGLPLARQIAEGHGGRLELRNRTDSRGCEARLRLPLT